MTNGPKGRAAGSAGSALLAALLLAASLLALAGPAAAGPGEPPPADGPLERYALDEDPFDELDPFDGADASYGEIADPLEPYNRVMFRINDKLIRYFIGPVLMGYSIVVPEPARVGVRRFFSNLTTPVRLVNSLLQLKGRAAGVELARFLINSTLGVGGLLDPAEESFDLLKQDEDFGQTLGFYGIGSGVYIIWPILGPSSVRDTVGLAGDLALFPVFYLYPDDLLVGFGTRFYGSFNSASLDLSTYTALMEGAFDPYVFFRNAYHQKRRSAIER